MPVPDPQESALTNEDIVLQLALMLWDDTESLLRMQRVNGLWRRVLDEEIWEQLTKQRFGEHVKGLDNVPPNCPYGPWQAQYLRLEKRCIALNDQERSHIVCNGIPMYIGWERRESAWANPCAILRSVCWLQLSTQFLGVTPGTYKVIWHINVAPSVGAVVTVFFDAIATACRDGKSYPRTDVQLRELTYPKEAPEKHAYRPCVVKAPGTLAAVEPHEGLVAPGAEGWNSLLFTSSVPKDQLVEQGHVGPGRWVTIEAGHFTVPERYTLDIATRMFDVTDWWKSGLAWDAVRLVRQSDTNP